MRLSAGKQVFVWIGNSTVDDINDLTLRIEGMGKLLYAVKYSDTWTGNYSDEMEINLLNNQFVLEDIQLKGEKDMAV